jgi:hypothetical protein
MSLATLEQYAVRLSQFGVQRDERQLRAVLADVGIGARTLGWGAQAVAACEPGLSGSSPMQALARSSARSYSARTVWSNRRS